MSSKTCNQIKNYLMAKVPVAKIMNIHQENTLELRDKGIGPTRDHSLLEWDI